MADEPAPAVDDYVRELVDQAPPLTAEMRDRLALLVRTPASAA